MAVTTPRQLLFPDGHCSSEGATHLKDGLMTCSRHSDWMPSTSIATPSRDWCSSQLSSRNHDQGGLQNRQRGKLFREPVLPVTLGPEPASSVISIQRWTDETRDWRKLAPQAIASNLTELLSSPPAPSTPRLYSSHLRPGDEESQRRVCQLEGLSAAVAVGTMQASREGCYWPSSKEVSFSNPQHVKQPFSRLFKTAPDVSSFEPKSQSAPEISTSEDKDTLAICQELLTAPGKPLRAALVRFVAVGEVHGRTSAHPLLGDPKEAQLCLRTTYLQALLEMPRHLHQDAAEALDAGSVIHTADVALLRGPIEEGAPWLDGPAPQIDILTAALQRDPRCDDQGQYARISEKVEVAKIVDHIFAVAVGLDVDVLVCPPLGISGASGCYHPAADAGDILHKAALQYGSHIPKVCVCQEYSGQVRASTWATFTAAAARGREPIQHRELVPIAASPYLRPGWSYPFAPENEKNHKRRGQRLKERATLGAAGQAITSC
eukprot:TRINITY_DN27207_c0_g1_i1.p1 TRINITY_DN27207_c0_g1~~TRINITY_DN27207_c0_g1_i1.p1  ORF type:complete len:536 (+),score=81.91 TRINITY_DN27207_c0_g1_i1:137-1609(+)